jgi:hypothetical protein
MWTYTHSVVARASIEVVHSLFEDVARWPEWNAGTEWVRLDGPVAVGLDGFEDETEVPDAGIVVRVRHSIEPVDAATVRITYRATIDGPAADAVGPTIGPDITADFPDVLVALVSRAEAITKVA